MLTSDLIVATVRGGVVRPRWIDPGDADLTELAERLIGAFRASVGERRATLTSRLDDILGEGTAFQLHRGLAKLLLDRSDFVSADAVAPPELRGVVFRIAAEMRRKRSNGAPGAFSRREVLENAARELGVTADSVEADLYADLKSEQRLASFKECTPRRLLERYNVALAQGVLLRAHELEIRLRSAAPARCAALARKLKFFRLLHRITPEPSGGYRIAIDGPLSLFQSSQKYGVQMAAFLPTLLHFDDWSLEARVAWGKKRSERRFVLDPSVGLAPVNRLTGAWRPAEIESLPGRIERLDRRWRAETDVTLIDLGGEEIMVPDATFVHEDGTRVVLEVLGYWRKAGLAGRLEKLRRYGPGNALIAVSRALLTSKEALDDLPGAVYVYRSQPIARRVHEHLEALRRGEATER